MVEVCIFYKKDSEEREKNLEIIKSMYTKLRWDVKIIEPDGEGKDCNIVGAFDKFLNESKAEIVIYQEADVFVNESQLIDAVNLASGGYPMVLPYNGWIWAMPKGFGIDKRFELNRMSVMHEAVGGIAVFNRVAYLDCGGENKNISGWGADEQERFFRMDKLTPGGVPRVQGMAYHLWHPSNPSPTTNAWTKNIVERDKVKSMDRDTLIEYIKGWSK